MPQVNELMSVIRNEEELVRSVAWASPVGVKQQQQQQQQVPSSSSSSSSSSLSSYAPRFGSALQSLVGGVLQVSPILNNQRGNLSRLRQRFQQVTAKGLSTVRGGASNAATVGKLQPEDTRDDGEGAYADTTTVDDDVLLTSLSSTTPAYPFEQHEEDSVALFPERPLFAVRSSGGGARLQQRQSTRSRRQPVSQQKDAQPAPREMDLSSLSAAVMSSDFESSEQTPSAQSIMDRLAALREQQEQLQGFACGDDADDEVDLLNGGNGNSNNNDDADVDVSSIAKKAESEPDLSGRRGSQAGGDSTVSTASSTISRGGDILKSVRVSTSSSLAPTPLDAKPTLPIRMSTHDKPILVLDLDETLIHSSLVPRRPADFWIEVIQNGDLRTREVFWVYKRPGVDAFLATMARYYTLVVFTAGIREYASQILDQLDPTDTLIAARLYRDSCTEMRGLALSGALTGGPCIPTSAYAKDMTRVCDDLSRVLLVDNTPGCFALQPANGLPIKSWYTDLTDRHLPRLQAFLSDVRDVEDIRLVLNEWHL